MNDDTSLKHGFIEWLRSKGKASKTIQNYAVTGINAADLMLSKQADWESFYQQTSLSKIKDAAESLRANKEWQEKDKVGKNMYSAGVNHFVEYAESFFRNKATQEALRLPKPFVLLAGISGTGKTRFVRKQAKATSGGLENYCHVAVRPDWHEPSDLLGYVSRLGSEGARYIATDVLRFMAQAWAEAADNTDDADKIILKNGGITPFWLCLDEMNLAPVEQYFADFLSILETRQWQNDEYTCDPLLKPELIGQLDEAGQWDLRDKLGLADEAHEGLWNSFVKHGIEIPPNLIVAGTVNMDETTHGFSRKVIDRAFTIDFGEFFPNDYARFFEPDTQPATLTYSEMTHVSQEDLKQVSSDPDGAKSIAFLTGINSILKQTPFELAYRAMNELLLMLVCFTPEDDTALQAVWDDFLMAKVLPRIEGDSDKLGADADGSSLLEQLAGVLASQLNTMSGENENANQRPDLFRVPKNKEDDSPVMTTCRSLNKLVWMQKRLNDQGFTAFWP